MAGRANLLFFRILWLDRDTDGSYYFHRRGDLGALLWCVRRGQRHRDVDGSGCCRCDCSGQRKEDLHRLEPILLQLIIIVGGGQLAGKVIISHFGSELFSFRRVLCLARVYIGHPRSNHCTILERPSDDVLDEKCNFFLCNQQLRGRLLLGGLGPDGKLVFGSIRSQSLLAAHGGPVVGGRALLLLHRDARHRHGHDHGHRRRRRVSCHVSARNHLRDQDGRRHFHFGRVLVLVLVIRGILGQQQHQCVWTVLC